jgi:lipoyl(octanoyl) transferase
MHIKHLGVAPYEPVWRAMQVHNRTRAQNSGDEIWIVQHPPIFTLGLAGKAEHLVRPGDIPVIQIDRGGQVTYHGPGQLVLYLLLDMKQRSFGVKELVRRIEQSLIDLLTQYAIKSDRRAGMPGVYVNDAKIAAIGLRVANHATFHGLSLNVEMDLQPFSRINPCGYEGLAVTQLHDLGVTDTIEVVAAKLVKHLQQNLRNHHG